jgi:hypothetical protein
MTTTTTATTATTTAATTAARLHRGGLLSQVDKQLLCRAVRRVKPVVLVSSRGGRERARRERAREMAPQLR